MDGDPLRQKRRSRALRPRARPVRCRHRQEHSTDRRVESERGRQDAAYIAIPTAAPMSFSVTLVALDDSAALEASILQSNKKHGLKSIRNVTVTRGDTRTATRGEERGRDRRLSFDSETNQTYYLRV